MNCPKHGIPLVCYCPACRGQIATKRKSAASRENGKLGGRPKGSKTQRKAKP
jgi:aryl-alcohol dehydrogenase-like predicted oxidoreductase